MKAKRFLAWALCLTMIISTLPAFSLSATAAETTTRKSISLGTSVIADGDKTNAKWDYVYYGSFNNNPIKWRVLSKDGNGGTYTDIDGNPVTAPMFLLSEYALEGKVFENAWNSDDGDGQTNPNDWQNSDAQVWCKNTFAVNSFSDAEKKYVLKTTKTDVAETLYNTAWDASELKADTAFYISAKEASEYLGADNGDEGLKVAGNVDSWWLRTPYYSGFYCVGCVDESGTVNNNYMVASNSIGARPAFNFNPESVLFTSEATGGKPNGFTAVTDYSGTEWKLTLLDSARSTFTASVTAVLGNKVAVSYSNATTGNNEYISAVIQNANGDITHYGRVGKVTAKNGIVEFDMPDITLESTDKLYIFNEQYNGDKKTDYASQLIEVTIPDDFNNGKVTLYTNDGTINSGDVTGYLYGVGVTLPTDVTRDYYVFEGWYEDADFTGDKVTQITPTETGDKTYYAKWIYKGADILGEDLIGNRVYFGQWDGEPIPWRVLDTGYSTVNGDETGILLLSEYVLGTIPFDSQTRSSNQWEGSVAEAWCKEFANAGIGGNELITDGNGLSAAEASKLLPVNKTDSALKIRGISFESSTLSNADVFFLSAAEANSYFKNGKMVAYLFSNRSSTANWWLRSPVSNYMGAVYTSGDFDYYYVYYHMGARPALVLDPSFVLFTSAATGGKSETFGEITPYVGEEWKLTMLDNSITEFNAEILKTSTKTVVSYSGAETGDNEYISAIIKDTQGNVTHYGRLKNVTGEDEARGMVEIDLSGKLTDTDTLYIFNEEYNGDYKTDYASGLQAVTIPGEVNAYDIIFNATGGSETMDSATVKFGDSYTLPANSFIPPVGKQFIGWATISGGEVIRETAITVDKDTALYAAWENIPAEAPTISSISDGYTGENALTYGEITADHKLTVTATSDSGGEYSLTYQWYQATSASSKDGATPISGATEASYPIPTVASAGEYYYYCTVKATRQDNSEIATADTEIIRATVNKAMPTLTAPTANTGLVYNGSSQPLVNAGITNGGEIMYKVNDGDWDTAVPMGKNVGTYTVYYKVAGDANYFDMEEKSLTVTIEEKPLIVTTEEKSLTVTTEEKTPTVNPQTGDNSKPWLWFALLVISGGSVITLTVYDRKRRILK